MKKNRKKIILDRQKDPTFFDQLLADGQIYNPETKEFEKTEIFSEETVEMIKEISFERLKELSAGEDGAHLDMIEFCKK